MSRRSAPTRRRGAPRAARGRTRRYPPGARAGRGAVRGGEWDLHGAACGSPGGEPVLLALRPSRHVRPPATGAGRPRVAAGRSCAGSLEGDPERPGRLTRKESRTTPQQRLRETARTGMPNSPCLHTVALKARPARPFRGLARRGNSHAAAPSRSLRLGEPARARGRSSASPSGQRTTAAPADRSLPPRARLEASAGARSEPAARAGTLRA